MKSKNAKVDGHEIVHNGSMKKRTVNALIITIIIIAALFGALVGNFYAPAPPHRDHPPHVPEMEQDPSNYLTILKTTITMMNIAISLILILLYFKIYNEVRSEFTIGLIVVMFALLIYCVTSNPLLLSLFGYRSFGTGPFMIIPDMFSTIGLATLLYLSLK
jgi:hypothetical protein